MANEIQRATADTLISTIEDGVIIFDFDGETTSAIAFGDLTSANIQAELEGLSNIGAGNVAVTDYDAGSGVVGFTITFQGTLANAPQVDITINSNTLKADASGITVVEEVTAGAVDVVSVVDNQINTTAVTPVTGEAEVQRIVLSSNTGTGSFDITDPSMSVTPTITTTDNELDDLQDLQDFYDSAYGSGNVLVAEESAGVYTVTFQGIYNDDDIGQSTISNETNVTVTVSTDNDGVTEVTGVHQVDHCTVSPAPTDGAITYQGQSLDWNVNANTLTLTGGSAVGTPASGLIVFTWDSYDTETPVTVDAATAVVAGAYQVATVTLDDSLNDGTLKITVDSVTSDSFAYNADATAVNTALASAAIPFTASGNTPSWTLTANAKAASVTVTAAEFDPLRRSVVVTMSEVQAGEAVAMGGGFMLLCAG